jgi:hypothetical protein
LYFSTIEVEPEANFQVKHPRCGVCPMKVKYMLAADIMHGVGGRCPSQRCSAPGFYWSIVVFATGSDILDRTLVTSYCTSIICVMSIQDMADYGII